MCKNNLVVTIAIQIGNSVHKLLDLASLSYPFVLHMTLPWTPHSSPLSSPSPSLQANCTDSTAEPEKVFAGEIKKMLAEKLKPQEQITLEPYERDHAVVIGMYSPVKKAKD